MNAEDLELESRMLGAIMLAKGKKDHVVMSLEVDDFGEPEHRRIFGAMLALAGRHEAISLRSVTSELRKDRFDPERLKAISECASDWASSEGFADRVRERTTRRRVAALSGEIPKINAESQDSAEAIASIRIRLDELQRRRGLAKGLTGLQVANAVIKDLEAKHELGGRLPGLSTGLSDVDQAIGGLQPQKFIVIAGRPGTGKTALVINIAWFLAVHEWKRVGVFSLEMGATELGHRMASGDARVNLQRVQSARLDASEWERVYSSLRLLSQSRMFIDDRGSLSIDELVAVAKVQHAIEPLDALMVDYIQLMDGRRGKRGGADNRQEEISQITRGLKSLSMELGIPVIGLAQLNRDLEKRTDKRPQLSDLRESGTLEQDADAVLMLYRDSLYTAGADPNVAELLIRKQRNGPTGMIPLRWSPENTRFDSMAVE